MKIVIIHKGPIMTFTHDSPINNYDVPYVPLSEGTSISYI